MKLEPANKMDSDKYYYLKCSLKEFRAFVTFINLNQYKMHWGEWLKLPDSKVKYHLAEEGFFILPNEVEVAKEFIKFMEEA